MRWTAGTGRRKFGVSPVTFGMLRAPNPPLPMRELITLYAELLPASIFAGVSVLLLALTLWVSRPAQRHLRIIRTVTSAPLVSANGTAEGLVKVRGRAEPASGHDPASTVYHESSRTTRARGRSSSRTTGFIYVADETGACAVNTEHAKVFTLRGEVKDDGMFESRNWSAWGEIRTGDPVFALGALRRQAPRGAARPGVGCELVPARGILLYSAVPEHHVQITHGIWLALSSLPLLALVALLGLTVQGHIRAYPPGERGRVAAFLETLVRDPMRLEPGRTHPAWPPVPSEDEPAGDGDDEDSSDGPGVFA